METQLRWSLLTRTPPRTTPQPDMPYAKVLARCVFPRRADQDPRIDAWEQCTTDLHQSIKELAAGTDMQVWGRCNGTGPLVAIPAGHWNADVEIDLGQARHGLALCRSSTADETGPWYDELTFDRGQVRQHLPPKWIASFRVLSCGFIKP